MSCRCMLLLLLLLLLPMLLLLLLLLSPSLQPHSSVFVCICSSADFGPEELQGECTDNLLMLSLALGV